MKKNILLLIPLLLMTVIGGCSDSKVESKSWQSFSPVPFSGYVCGFENSKPLFQLPVFFKDDDSLSEEDISRVIICSEDVEIECEDVSMLSVKESSKQGYLMSTLLFRPVFPTEGKYDVDTIKIYLHDGRTIEKKLGSIALEVIKENSWDDMLLFASDFMLNQSNTAVIKVTYINKYDSDVKLERFIDTSVDYKIQMYADMECKIEEDDTTIPSGEKRTFVFSADNSDESIGKDDQYLFFLPFVEFSSDQFSGLIPMQSQPLIIQPPFTDEYVAKVVGDFLFRP